jgi:photosystem II stability/assembly factor-like uncharacterized protein
VVCASAVSRVHARRAPGLLHTASVGYAAPLDGAQARLYRTRNGGRSWRPLGWLPWAPGEPFGAAQFVTLQEGFVLSGGDLYRSKDGGESWRLVDARLSVAPSLH